MPLFPFKSQFLVKIFHRYQETCCKIVIHRKKVVSMEITTHQRQLEKREDGPKVGNQRAVKILSIQNHTKQACSSSQV